MLKKEYIFLKIIEKYVWLCYTFYFKVGKEWFSNDEERLHYNARLYERRTFGYCAFKFTY